MFGGMGIQITRFVPGVLANKSYPLMSHEGRLRFVKNFARTFDALWQLHLPERFMIGELRAIQQDGSFKFSVLPDRHHSLGGPFNSVADYLRAHIRRSVRNLPEATGYRRVQVTVSPACQGLCGVRNAPHPNCGGGNSRRLFAFRHGIA